MHILGGWLMPSVPWISWIDWVLKDDNMNVEDRKKVKENAKTSLVVYIIFNYPPLETDTAFWRQSKANSSLKRFAYQTDACRCQSRPLFDEYTCSVPSPPSSSLPCPFPSSLPHSSSLPCGHVFRGFSLIMLRCEKRGEKHLLHSDAALLNM